LPKPRIAQAAGGFFDRLGVSLRFEGGVDARFMKGQVEFCGERTREFEIAVGLIAAQAVMEMRGMKHEAKLGTAICERADERDGICSAGEANGEAESGLEQRSVEFQCRAHQRMIAPTVF
jgi:hypothetical protein